MVGFVSYKFVVKGWCGMVVVVVFGVKVIGGMLLFVDGMLVVGEFIVVFDCMGEVFCEGDIVVLV